MNTINLEHLFLNNSLNFLEMDCSDSCWFKTITHTVCLSVKVHFKSSPDKIKLFQIKQSVNFDS
jgi:hypothetical protein